MNDADGTGWRNRTAAPGIYWSMSPGIVAESDLSGNLKSEYVFFNGKRIARKDLSGSTPSVSYYFSDNLKTAHVITDSAGNITEDEDFYPFGGELPFINNDPNKYKFGGNERDGESGLDHIGVRYYSNSLSRFTTPDPLMVQKQKLLDPQQWSMYQYARNNPLRFNDPTGKYVCEGNKTQCGVVRSALDNAKTAAGKLDQGSKERKQLDRAIKAFGKEGDKNGVYVTFKHEEGGGLAGTTTEPRIGEGRVTTVNIDLKQVGKDYANVPNTAAEVTGLVAHEGAIAADQQANGQPRSRADIHQEEVDGATAQAGVHEGLGTKSAYGVWDPAWDPKQAPGLRDAAIRREADSATALDCKNNPDCH